MSTTVSKFSVSMPSYIYQQLAARLGKREVSGFVTAAVEEKLLNTNHEDAVEAFLAMRSKLPKFDRKTIKDAIVKGRM